MSKKAFISLTLIFAVGLAQSICIAQESFDEDGATLENSYDDLDTQDDVDDDFVVTGPSTILDNVDIDDIEVVESGPAVDDGRDDDEDETDDDDEENEDIDEEDEALEAGVLSLEEQQKLEDLRGLCGMPYPANKLSPLAFMPPKAADFFQFYLRWKGVYDGMV